MLNAHIEGKHIILTGDLRGEFQQFHDLPAIWDGKSRVLVPNLKENRQRFGLEEAKMEAVPIEGPFIVDGYQFKRRPYDHQLKEWQQTRDETAWGHLFEQGTGKSKVTIDEASWLYQTGAIEAVVIVAPNNVHANWARNEFPAECNIDWTAAVYFASGVENFGNPAVKGLKVFCFNIEGFVSEKAKLMLERILKTYTCMLVVDESSRIKTHSALRTKFMLRMAPLARYRRILSGTPVTQGMEDLYCQFQFLDPGILACRTFYTFRARYCRMGGFKNKQIIGYLNIDELQERIGKHSTRVLKQDCLDLPAKIYQTLPFRLSPEQQRLYNAVRLESLLELEELIGAGKTLQVVSEMAMTRILRLQQITSGLMPETDGLPIPGKNARMEALMDRLEDLPGKAIIFARFRADIENICKHLPQGSFVQLHGGTKTNERMEAVRSFQEDPHIRYFVGNPAAAGIGITLTAAEAVIYYSQDFNLEYRLQSEDRAHRIGQTKHVLIIDLIAEKTVDEKIVKALRAKHSLAKMILKDPAGFIGDSNA